MDSSSLFVRSSSKKRIQQVVALVFLVVLGVGGVIAFQLSQQSQDNRQQAFESSRVIGGFGCVTGGCSGELCVDSSISGDLMTTCVFRPEYACYQFSRCERQADGKCGWTETEEYYQCMGGGESKTTSTPTPTPTPTFTAIPTSTPLPTPSLTPTPSPISEVIASPTPTPASVGLCNRLCTSDMECYDRGYEGMYTCYISGASTTGICRLITNPTSSTCQEATSTTSPTPTPESTIPPTATPTPVASPNEYNRADINRDGTVDLADYTIMTMYFFQAATFEQGDIDGDGEVTLADYTIWASEISF